MSGAYEGAVQQIAAHGLQMLKNRGIDRALWNRRWVKVASTPTQVLRTTYFEDWRQYEEATDAATAEKCLERCLSGLATLSPLDRDEVVDDLFLEAATLTAWKTGDAKKSEIWFRQALHPENAGVLTWIRAKVALHCAHGRFDAAIVEWEKGLQAIHGFPFPTSYQCDKSKMVPIEDGSRRAEGVCLHVPRSLMFVVMFDPSFLTPVRSKVHPTADYDAGLAWL
jgi:hypothetical protein